MGLGFRDSVSKLGHGDPKKSPVDSRRLRIPNVPGPSGQDASCGDTDADGQVGAQRLVVSELGRVMITVIILEMRSFKRQPQARGLRNAPA